MDEEKGSDPIVICGIGGRLPGRDSWFNNMTNPSGSRWPRGIHGIANRVVTVEGAEKFDSGAFSVHSRMADSMDPQSRIMMEVVWEAMVDAGLHPDSLRDSKTAVWIGCARAEAGEALCGQDDFEGYIVLGNCRALYSNRISYVYNLKGHSVTVDGGGATSGAMLSTAISYLEHGRCNYAVVGATHLAFKPGTQLGYDELCGGASLTRGEGVVAVVLCKQSLAIRPYAVIRGISSAYVGAPVQRHLLKSLTMKTYLLSHVDPMMVDLLHVAQLPNSQSVEQQIISEVFNADITIRSRDKYYECVNGLVTIIESCMELLNHPRRIVGINDLSMTGNFSHVILAGTGAGSNTSKSDISMEITPDTSSDLSQKARKMKRSSASRLTIKLREKAKSPVMKKCKTESCITLYSGRNGSGEVKNSHKVSHLATVDTPLVAAGRTEYAVKTILNFCSSNGIHSDKVKMLQQCIGSGSGSNLPYRGFILNDVTMVTKTNKSDLPPIWLVCGGVGSQWPGMINHYLSNPVGCKVLDEVQEILCKKSVDLNKLVCGADMELFDDPKYLFVGIAIVQIIQVEVLRKAGVSVEGVIGHSFGEHCAAYVAGCITKQEFILAALARGKVVTVCEPGAMAVVTLPWEHAQSVATEFKVEVVCDNARKLVTMAGLQPNIVTMVKVLQERGQFARVLPTANQAYHSSLMKPAAPKLSAKLNKIITEVREPEVIWLSSSRQTPFSRDYFTNNLQLPVRFTDSASKIPQNAVVLEVGPHHIIKPLLRGFPNTIIPLLAKDNASVTMGRALGELYTLGYDVKLLDQVVPYPGCPPVGHVVQWDHRESWYIPKYDDFMVSPPQKNKGSLQSRIFVFDLDKGDSYLLGHSIDGSPIFPAAGYISLVVDMLQQDLDVTAGLDTVVLKEVSFLNAVPLTSSRVSFTVHLDNITKFFTIEESGKIISTGYCETTTWRGEEDTEQEDTPSTPTSLQIGKLDYYKEMDCRGYTYTSEFQMIETYSPGVVNMKRSFNKIIVIDAMLQLHVFECPGRILVLPSRINQLLFCPSLFEGSDKSSQAVYNHKNRLWSDGVSITSVTGTVVERRIRDNVQIFKEVFTPFSRSGKLVRKEHVEHRSKVLSYLVREPTDPGEEESEMSPLMQLGSGVEKLSYSQVLQDPIFNEMISLDAIKPILDIVFENVKQRVNVLVVDPFSCWKSPKIPFDKWYPERIVVEKSYENVPQLMGELPTVPSSTLVVCLHVFNDTNLHNTVEQLLKLTRGVKDVFVYVTQIHSLKGVSRLLLTTPLSIPVNPGTVSNIVQAFTARSQLHFLADNMSLVMQRDGITSSDMVFTRSHISLDHTKVVNIDSQGDFIAKLQQETATENASVIVTNYEKSYNGLLGLAKCLFAENLNIKSVSHIEDACSALTNLLTHNVFHSKAWGTYTYEVVKERHGQPIQVERNPAKIEQETMGSFCRIQSPGDLSSLCWYSSPYSRSDVTIVFSSLNFRDVMIVSGKLNVSSLPYDGNKSELCGIGIEYTGYLEDGNGVMGILPCKAIATHAPDNYRHLRWKIPAGMSMEEAATIPLAYSTAYYGLIVRAGLKRGDTILIHCGAGAVGTAAIQLALSLGCEVFTTVSSTVKQNHLLSLFPDLKKQNIGHSRTAAFVNTVIAGTRGKGVDVALNSLAGPLLVATARCVKAGGHFVEIGKYDMQQNTPVPLHLIKHGCSIHGVQVDELWLDSNKHLWHKVHELVQEGLNSGVVKPLVYKVYDKVEDALKYLTTGLHIGKILLDVEAMGRQESLKELVDQAPVKLESGMRSMVIEEIDIGRKCMKMTPDFQQCEVAHVNFTSQGVILITGGMGGLGIEVATYIMRRGGRVLLVGRSPPKPQTIVSLNAAGDNYTIVRGDVTDEGFLTQLFADHHIVGVWHLAGSLNDSLLGNLTPQIWNNVVKVKIEGAKLLNKLSTRVDHFICFSSIVSALGNAGQCSYGYGNATLDSICRERQERGLPGLSIQWGLIKTGMGERVKQTCGSAPMSLPAFHETLDKILSYKLQGVVLTYTPMTATSSSSSGNSALLSKVLKVLGVSDLKSNGDMSLSRFGMDSLMAVELSAILARDAGVSLTADQIRDFTFLKLNEICTSE